MNKHISEAFTKLFQDENTSEKAVTFIQNNPHIIYYDVFKKFAQYHLLANSYNHIYYLTTFTYKNVYTGILTKNLSNVREIEIVDAVSNYLIDCIRISLFYENYMKGILLSEGYLIHKKKVGNSDSPILFEEIDKSAVDSRYEFKIYSLTDNTITISQLLNKKYQSIIKLPEHLLNFLKEINTNRNKLHLYLKPEIKDVRSYIINLTHAIDHIEERCLPLQIELMNHFNPKLEVDTKLTHKKLNELRNHLSEVLAAK